MTPEVEREIWKAVRQGLLLIVGAIERAFGWRRRCERCREPLDDTD